MTAPASSIQPDSALQLERLLSLDAKYLLRLEFYQHSIDLLKPYQARFAIIIRHTAHFQTLNQSTE